MQRAICWIIQADIFAQGVTNEELELMMPGAEQVSEHSWLAFPEASRKIVTRLAGIISAPELDAVLVSRAADEMAGIKAE